MADDPHAIKTTEALRAVVGEALPGLDQKNQPLLDEFAVDFLERSPLLVLATADAQGGLDASPKGDGPGFVLVEDERTLVIPDRPGNKLVYGHQNIIDNPKVGLLFMIPGTPETLRVNGTAELSADPALLERLAARGGRGRGQGRGRRHRRRLSRQPLTRGPSRRRSTGRQESLG